MIQYAQITQKRVLAIIITDKNMEKEFVPYELALKLKELGFKEECLAFYDGTKAFTYSPNNNKIYAVKILAPLYQQTFDWFREKYNLHCVVDEYENPKSWGYLINNDDLDEAFNFRTYEEARLECLKKLIELCEKKN